LNEKRLKAFQESTHIPESKPASLKEVTNSKCGNRKQNDLGLSIAFRKRIRKCTTLTLSSQITYP